MDAPPVTLDLAADPAAVPALRRALGLGRARPLRLEWHDRAGRLAAAGVALVAWREGRLAGWRAERLHAAPGMPPPVLAAAPSPAALGLDLPEGVAPVAGLAGRLRTGMQGPVALRLVEDGARARLTLAGPAAAVAALAGTPGLRVAGRSLAAEALDVPPALGAPALAADPAPGETFARAAAHLLGVLLHHAPRVGTANGEPVHQMRVALRRLRAAVAAFRPAVDCPALDALRPELRALARALGPARDWDVFLGETGAAVAAAFPDEPAVAALLAAAAARRDAAYAALAPVLAGAGLRQPALRLALLVQVRPWAREGPWPADGPGDTAGFGAALLARRLRRFLRHAEELEALPDGALHALRIEAKRLRYAAEIFAPLLAGRPARRLLRRLAELQEGLGLLNDGATAAALMGALPGGDGLAGGLVRGFVAGRAEGARAAAARGARRLRKAAGPFL